MPTALTQTRYITTCAFFLRQAKQEGHDTELKHHVVNRFFCHWPVPSHTPDIHSVIKKIKVEILRDLQWAAYSAHMVKPTVHWEVMFALSSRAWDAHANRLLDEFETRQQTLRSVRPPIFRYAIRDNSREPDLEGEEASSPAATEILDGGDEEGESDEGHEEPEQESDGAAPHNAIDLTASSQETVVG
ncbi:hypothetical protein EST38_g12312 [Candolleomyces aberdarensis]|uniref:Uncharacterized protein n=1 Tax=Candolleomyces aberdarensis TaxID=2316362 RepID=A0A4Q2D503_9AGAR|nr:hypothetical protein EST38_g12312 [Candolleomyces aberdarensis]